jgi:hypothetical protein
MFGMLNPGRQDAAYRRCYARCCQHQQVSYGITSLPFHSYEAVLLYLIAVDAGVVDEAELPDQVCCRLRAGGAVRQAPDAAIGTFCSSLALLLASVKVRDDINDDHSLTARMTHWLLRKRFGQAGRYFAALDPNFDREMRALFADHARMESRGGPVPIEEYAAPTGRAFGYVFGLMSRLSRMDSWERLLRQVGAAVGTAIIGFDCASDLVSDQVAGPFNPLPDRDAAVASLRYAAHHLLEGARLCREAFGPESRSGGVLAVVGERLAEQSKLDFARSCSPVAAGVLGFLPLFAANSPTPSPADPVVGFGICALICCCVAGGGCNASRGTVRVRDDCGNVKEYELREKGSCG